MPNEQTKKTLAELHKEFKARGINKMIPILEKMGKKRVWFFLTLKNPKKLSLVERQCFAEEFEVHIEEINWQDEPILIG